MKSTSIQNNNVMTTEATTTTTRTTILLSSDEELLQGNDVKNETVHSFISEVSTDFNLEQTSSLMRTIDELCATHKPMSPSPIRKRHDNHNQSSQMPLQNFKKTDNDVETTSTRFNNNITPTSTSKINSTYSGRGRRGRPRGRTTSTGAVVDKGIPPPNAPLMIMNHQFSNTLLKSPLKVGGTADSTDQDMNEDYEHFVTSLCSKQEFEEDDEMSYKLSEDEEDNDDDENELALSSGIPSYNENSLSSTVLDDLLQSREGNDQDDDSIYNDLNEELSNLIEEDLLASVTNLAQQQHPTNNTSSTLTDSEKKASLCSDNDAKYIISKEKQPTQAHVETLRQLLSQHYQLLLQQSIISIRTAYCQKNGQEYEHTTSSSHHSDAVVNESSTDDLIEILDGSIGMLKDIFDNRNDAVRKNLHSLEDNSNQHMTRSAFRTTLREEDKVFFSTNFDIKGIKRLEDTMKLIDNCCDDDKVYYLPSSEEKILKSQTHNEACAFVLNHANANIKKNVLPSRYNFSTLFTYPFELMGNNEQSISLHTPSTFPLPTFDLVVTKELIPTQRNQFTSGEDNLILRGVNLYGEKEWSLISDRFLPDRSISSISQRYSRLCYLFYKASGVQIDSEGNLPTPPIIQDNQYDETDASTLNKVKAPIMFDTHRWSLEEDLTLLKAVPIFGNNWAVIRQMLIPHRDRGHLRKRYQVLERRVKGALRREKKGKGGKSNKKEPNKSKEEIISNVKSEPSSDSAKKTDLLLSINNNSSSEIDSLPSNQKNISDEEDEVQKCSSLPSLSSCNDESVMNDEKCSVYQRDLPQSQQEFVASSKPESSPSSSRSVERMNNSAFNEEELQHLPLSTSCDGIDITGSLLCNEDMSPFVDERLSRTKGSPTTPGPCSSASTPKKKSATTSFVDKVISIRPKSSAMSSKEDFNNASCLLSPSFVFATPMNLDCSLLGFERILKDNTNSLSKLDHVFQNEHYMTSSIAKNTPLFSALSNHTPLFSILSNHSKINMSSTNTRKQLDGREHNEKRNIFTEVAAEAIMKQPENINEVHKLARLDSIDTFSNVMDDEHILSALTFPDQLNGHGSIVDIDVNLNNENSFNCFDVSSISFEEDFFTTRKRQKVIESNKDESSHCHSMLHINLSNTIETQLENSHQSNIKNHMMPLPLTPPPNYSLNQPFNTATIVNVNNKRSFFEVAIGSVKDKKRDTTIKR